MQCQFAGFNNQYVTASLARKCIYIHTCVRIFNSWLRSAVPTDNYSKAGSLGEQQIYGSPLHGRATYGITVKLHL